MVEVVACHVETAVEKAMQRGGVIDITTFGAKTGKPRRIEIDFHHLDGNYYITGEPGFKRDWLANMKATPLFTVHLKHGVTADVPAEAEEITTENQRADVLYRILTESWDTEPAKAEHNLPRWIKDAPLVEFTIV